MQIKKVVVAVSGGVDSAVSAYLLKSKGYDVHGVFMRNWDLVDENGHCSSDEDWKYAQVVCRKLDIKLSMVNFVKEYWTDVFKNFIRDYENGLTPNPDILCNRNIKFNLFFKHAVENLKADVIATGHYACSSFGQFLENHQSNKSAKLLKAVDKFKDQTFFLSQISQESLNRTMFPIGLMNKAEVKKIATDIGFAEIVRKKESTGICFIGERYFQNFISEYIEKKPGQFIDYDTGQDVGTHEGIHNWTIGQRCRLGGCLKPYFVLKKCLSNNHIYVVSGTDHPSLFTNILYTEPPYWIQDFDLGNRLLDCEFRFQHTKPLENCVIFHGNDRSAGLFVRLRVALRALTPGQYAVFYRNDECLGSARILRPGPSLQYLQFKLAHQFWFSYQPPAASGGSSANQKPPLTDEEKQKERQKIETREKEQQKQAELDAAYNKREAREVRQLDIGLLSQRRAQERERQAQFDTIRQKEQKEQKILKSNQMSNAQNNQTQKWLLNESIDLTNSTALVAATTATATAIATAQSISCGGLVTSSLEQNDIHISNERNNIKSVSNDTSINQQNQQNCNQGVGIRETGSANLSLTTPINHKDLINDDGRFIEYNKDLENKSHTPSPILFSDHTLTHMSVLNSTPVPIINPTAILKFTSIRGDSIDSELSLTHSKSHNDGLSKQMCRAPIASLDCMEEFSGTGGHLDFGRSISLGSNPVLPIRQNTTTTPGLRYKNLGKSGLRVSNVGLGTWPIFSPGVSEEQAEAILKLAVESGINLFDLSEAHSGIRAELELGRIIQKSGWKRSGYVITTKIYWSTKSDERGLSRKHIIESVRASLQRLQLQYIDIVIVHKADSMCPMEEVVRAMNYVISQGWAMYWGTARWSPVEIMEAYTNCRQFNCVTPIVEQAEYHMFCREKAELYLPEMYNKIGVGLMAWGPLSMFLSDIQNGERLLFPKGSFKTKSQSYSWTEDEVNKEDITLSKERIDESRRYCDKIRDIGNLAEKLGCSATQLSIAWSLKHEPVQCLLLGATSAEQLHQSLQALQLLPRLSTSVMLEIERILENKPVRPPPISTLALR